MKDFPSYGESDSGKFVREPAEGNSPFRLRFAMAWLTLFFVAMLFVAQRVEYLRAERQVKKLIHQKRTLVSEILPLQLEARYLTQVHKIEALADQLNLVAPKPWQIIKPKAPQRISIESKP